MGTPDFAVPCLEAINNSKHEILAVVTQPDRPKGRGKKVSPPPVKIKAQESGLNILQPKKVKDKNFIRTLQNMDLDCIVVVAYGQILPKEILNIPVKGCINVHASLLPRYRGAAPINWAIIRGESKTGITTMYMDEGLDTGDMILKKEVIIEKNMTAGELHDRLAVVGAEVLMETLRLIELNEAPRVPQNDSESSYASMLDKKMGLIDWSKSAVEVFNLIRGLNPWPVAYTKYKSKSLKVWKARISNEKGTNKFGEILKVSKEGILVSTGCGTLLIEEIQFPNSRRMSVDEYIRGNILEKGIVLGE
jgi:methionyl-tRNA formyltransferase